MTGERIGSIPVPPETNAGAYALYEENDSLMLLSQDLKCFRLENGSFVGENGFTVDDPRNINGKIKVSFNGTDIMIDAGDCTALGVYRIANDRIFCIGYGTNVTYRLYDLSGELIGASFVDGSNALYNPISPMFVSP